LLPGDGISNAEYRFAAFRRETVASDPKK